VATARKALGKFALNTFNFTDVSNEVRRPNARSIFNDWQHKRQNRKLGLFWDK